MAKLPTLGELNGIEEGEEDEEQEEVNAMDRKFHLLVLDAEKDEWERVEGPTSYGKCLTAAKDYYEQPWGITVELEKAEEGMGLVALQPAGFLPLSAMDDILDAADEATEAKPES